MNPIPLLSDRDPEAPLAWRHGVPVSARQFLADVARFAPELEAGGPVINLCVDRYAFAVSLAAALVRGETSLLPPDARPDTLARLVEAGGHTFAIVDAEQAETPGMPRILIENRAPVADAGDRPVPEIASDLHAVSLLTSGSTGTPQPHAKSWQTLVGDVAAAVDRLSGLLGRPSLAGLTLVATVPVQHSYGLESSVLLAMLGGAAFDSGRPFFPADVAAALASVPQPRALVTTPFHLKTLLLSGVALPPVDLILSATAPLSPQLAAQAEEATGGMLIEIYGSTESGQVATRRPTQSEVWETFGQIRVHSEHDAEGGERFIFEGDFIPEPTPLADVLELVDDRRFRLLGRANDLIHVAGRRSSLGYLNHHLNSIPGVVDGAFWLPDDVTDGVVRPVAFVVAPALDAHAIIAALRERLEAVFVPRRVVHVTAFPREGTGKLTARALREFALAQLASDGTPVQLTHEVPADHPAFAGHFPGQPLLPGALLLSEVLEAVQGVPALAARLGAQPTLAAAKFLAPVRPGSTLVIDLIPETGASRGLRFEVHSSGVTVASGRWTPGSTA
ncbi:Acyl-coenzyme A synthetase/AMP-(fatty) acid ligase [Variovorax sp. CF079]|uniref:AMP-binding protein n=1 Tax=Variovorax sp. CF079 TaxID=1882774 RepID=UPI0008871083|nr:AMP-binding protein [Variovorax sp. CF079]SDD44319.1 Acyl-coenzyme A synthetase/AMP-(fatty) acid ligase [Variovorax sp. CF079]